MEKTMDEPTLEQVIDGFRRMPLLGGIGERAAVIAVYMTRSRTVVTVDHIDGAVAHFIQSSILDDFENFRLRGYMGDAHRVVTSRFEIDMNPDIAIAARAN